MSLKITLKPHERLIIGGAVVVNSNSKCNLIIENNVPILRGKDIMSLKDADTPCKRIYFVIQLMYVDEKNMADNHKTYWELVRDVTKAAPSRKPLLREISENVLHNRYYQALKVTRKLVEYEREVINQVRKSAKP